MWTQQREGLIKLDSETSKNRPGSSRDDTNIGDIGTMNYIAYLDKDPSSDFGVSFPDFPGCVTAGKTLEEARRLAGEALMLHVKGMVEDGDAIPEPSSLDDLTDDPAMRGAVAVLVGLESSEKSVRVNITARQSQIDQIDRLAAKSGMSRSAYMVRAATSAKFVREPC